MNVYKHTCMFVCMGNLLVKCLHKICLVWTLLINYKNTVMSCPILVTMNTDTLPNSIVIVTTSNYLGYAQSVTCYFL